MAEPTNFLHLARPLGPVNIGAQSSTTPLSVTVQPQALFSILDHTLRRNKDQDRVIGTLLGTRSDDGTEVSIQNCYAVPHTETQEQVEVDMDYQKNMLSLHLRANPKEVLVGWYATSSDLNTFSALIQNFYGQQGDGTWPHPAVHLTVSTEPGQPPEARTYISAPIGVTAERAGDSCLFIPVPHEIKYGDAERSGLELISSAKEREDRSTGIVTDIEVLERSIEYVLEMLERVSNYVSSVLDEEAEPSTALGQFLLNTLSLAPKVEVADVERDLYVPVALIAMACNTDDVQQQSHPGRASSILLSEHHPHTNRSVKPIGDGGADDGSCIRWAERRRRGRSKGREARWWERARARSIGRGMMHAVMGARQKHGVWRCNVVSSLGWGIISRLARSTCVAVIYACKRSEIRLVVSYIVIHRLTKPFWFRLRLLFGTEYGSFVLSPLQPVGFVIRCPAASICSLQKLPSSETHEFHKPPRQVVASCATALSR